MAVFIVKGITMGIIQLFKFFIEKKIGYLVELTYILNSVKKESSKLGCIQRIRDGASLVVIEFMKRTFEKIS